MFNVVILLSYYFILSESDFLGAILPTILATNLLLEVKIAWKISAF